MGAPRTAGADGPRRPRILEIGDHNWFKRALPGQTTTLWTGRRDPPFVGPADYVHCTPTAFMRAMREVRAGGYDLVVAYPHLSTAWHPRYWAATWLRHPLAPYAALSRGSGVPLLRFVRLPVPLVALDVHDDFRIGRHSFFLLDAAALYYKRELPTDRWLALHGSAHPGLPTFRIRRDARWQARIAKLRPMALDTEPRWDDAEAAFRDKRTDIFFAGAVEGNSTVRTAGIDELRALAADGVKVDIPEGVLPREEFHRRMLQSWLTWSPSGRGWECFRHLEAPRALSVPVMNYPTVLRHAPLVEGEHAVFYAPEPGGLRRAVLGALQDRERLKGMALAARAHVLAHHTLEAHCRFILRSALGDAGAVDANEGNPGIAPGTQIG